MNPVAARSWLTLVDLEVPTVQELRSRHMANNLVATSAALQRCLEMAPDGWYETFACPADGSWDVLSVSCEGSTCLVARTDSQSSRKAVVLAQDGHLLSPSSVESRREMLQRIHRLLIESEAQPVHLPFGWSEFRHDNLIAFFACRKDQGALRWIAELNVRGSHDVGFWVLTTPGRELQLHEFSDSEKQERRSPL